VAGIGASGSSESEWFCAACAEPSNELGAESAKSVSRSPLPSVRAGRRDHLRVLLVDDQDMVRRSTARSLAGFELVTASSGAEALAILSKDLDFDAVLSDVMMPLMTGPDLFERCCAQYPQLAQRFVFARVISTAPARNCSAQSNERAPTSRPACWQSRARVRS